MTARGDVRSAMTPPASRLARSGSICAARTRPRAEAEPPMPRAAKGRATLTIPSPNSEMACPLNSRRKSRWRRTSIVPKHGMRHVGFLEAGQLVGRQRQFGGGERVVEVLEPGGADDRRGDPRLV